MLDFELFGRKLLRLAMDTEFDTLSHSNVNECPQVDFGGVEDAMDDQSDDSLYARDGNLGEAMLRELESSTIEPFRRVFVDTKPNLHQGGNVEDHEEYKGDHGQRDQFACNCGGTRGSAVPAKVPRRGRPAIGRNGFGIELNAVV